MTSRIYSICCLVVLLHLLTLSGCVGLADIDVQPLSLGGLKYDVKLLQTPIVSSEPSAGGIQLLSKHGQRFSCDIQTIRADEEKDSLSSVDNEMVDTWLSGLNPIGSIDNCMKLHTGWWTYTFCYKREITQFHEVHGEKTAVTSLGVYESEYDWSAENSETPEVTGKYHSQNYTNGTVCNLTGKPRRTEVRFVCLKSPSFELISIVEYETCVYILKVAAPTFCDHPTFVTNFRPKPKEINCHPTLSELEYRQYEAERMANQTQQETVAPKAEGISKSVSHLRPFGWRRASKMSENVRRLHLLRTIRASIRNLFESMSQLSQSSVEIPSSDSSVPSTVTDQHESGEGDPSSELGSPDVVDPIAGAEHAVFEENTEEVNQAQNDVTPPDTIELPPGETELKTATVSDTKDTKETSDREGADSQQASIEYDMPSEKTKTSGIHSDLTILQLTKLKHTLFNQLSQPTPTTHVKALDIVIHMGKVLFNQLTSHPPKSLMDWMRVQQAFDRFVELFGNMINIRATDSRLFELAVFYFNSQMRRYSALQPSEDLKLNEFRFDKTLAGILLQMQSYLKELNEIRELLAGHTSSKASKNPEFAALETKLHSMFSSLKRSVLVLQATAADDDTQTDSGDATNSKSLIVSKLRQVIAEMGIGDFELYSIGGDDEAVSTIFLVQNEAQRVEQRRTQEQESGYDFQWHQRRDETLQEKDGG